MLPSVVYQEEFAGYPSFAAYVERALEAALLAKWHLPEQASQVSSAAASLPSCLEPGAPAQGLRGQALGVVLGEEAASYTLSLPERWWPCYWPACTSPGRLRADVHADASFAAMLRCCDRRQRLRVHCEAPPATCTIRAVAARACKQQKV